MTDRPVGFLGRWSRRKRTGQQVRRSKTAPVLPEERVWTEERGYAAAAAARPQQAVAPAETSPVPQSAPTEAEERTTGLPDLPPIESLGKDSDYSVFLKQGVPEKLQRLALRKLWRFTVGVPDGLDDYDEDYTIVEMVAEGVSSGNKIRQAMAGTEDEEASAEGQEAEQKPAPCQAGEEDAEAEKTTDASHQSDAAAESDEAAAAIEGRREESDKA
jgi:hypothetical protein